MNVFNLKKFEQFTLFLLFTGIVCYLGTVVSGALLKLLNNYSIFSNLTSLDLKAGIAQLIVALLTFGFIVIAKNSKLLLLTPLADFVSNGFANIFLYINKTWINIIDINMLTMTTGLVVVLFILTIFIYAFISIMKFTKSIESENLDVYDFSWAVVVSGICVWMLFLLDHVLQIKLNAMFYSGFYENLRLIILYFATTVSLLYYSMRKGFFGLKGLFTRFIVTYIGLLCISRFIQQTMSTIPYEPLTRTSASSLTLYYNASLYSFLLAILLLSGITLSMFYVLRKNLEYIPENK